MGGDHVWMRNDLKNLSKSNSDSVGVAKCFAGLEISHLFTTDHHFVGGGGFKVALICHLFATYYVHLLLIWQENTNKWQISGYFECP
jgi:hypothetical protein